MPTDEMKQPVLRGWIIPCAMDSSTETDVAAMRRELESLGVQVGLWDMFDQEFQECVVSADAMDNLDPLWGRYIWGLSLTNLAQDQRKG